jgi:Zn-dependent M16 (insulinase) family peptidase
MSELCLMEKSCFATTVDHTAYTLTTAGSEGFLNILPIFCDHILNPILSDDSFLTEVHHIDGKGDDAGVVYCEMQGVENDGDTLAMGKLRHIIYGTPDVCGYSSETGGKLACLRDLTNAKVQQYHRDYYRPENLCLVVVGPVDVE